MGGGGNWEFQWYTNSRKNSFVTNSTLFLKPSFTAEHLGSEDALRTGRQEIWGASPSNLCTGNAWYGCERTPSPDNILNPVMSARVTTVESFAFTFGRVEVRAKLPRGDWLWPAIWLLPQKNEYGDWPQSGEIDIMESRGNAASCVSQTGEPLGNNHYGAAMHWGPKWNQNAYPLTVDYTVLPDGRSFADEFHVFGLLWTEEGMIFYLDTEENVVLQTTRTDYWQWGAENGFWNAADFNPWQYAQSPAAPFDRQFHLVMNVAVGGTTGYFPDGVCNKPWTNAGGCSQCSFYNAKATWLPTWQDSRSGSGPYDVGDSAALQIDWVRVTSL